jgi:hypothetical protein
MARAALRLYERGDPGEDLRIPIAFALMEIYGANVSDEELADLLEAILPVELNSLGISSPNGSLLAPLPAEGRPSESSLKK